MEKLILILVLLFSFSDLLSKEANNYHNRYFFYNKLVSIYGPKSKPILEKYFYKNATIYGGPCDPYEFDESNPSTYIRDCNSGIHEMRSKLNSSNSNLKNYYFHQVCTELSKIKHIKIKNWKTLYQQYYPLEKIPKVTIFGKQNKIEDISYTLCMSEKWKKY